MHTFWYSNFNFLLNDKRFRTRGFLNLVFIPKFVFLILLISPLSGMADSKKIREEIKKIIQVQHPFDNADTWRNLGPETPAVLIDLYKSEGDAYEKSRYLQALGWFPENKDAVDFIKSVLSQASSGDENRLIRINCIHTLVKSQGEKALSTLEEYIENADPQTRIAAAISLVRLVKVENLPVDHPAQKLLIQFKKKNTERFISEKLDREEKKYQESGENSAIGVLLGIWKGYWIEKGLVRKGEEPELEVTPIQVEVIVGQGADEKKVVFKITGNGNSQSDIAKKLKDKAIEFQRTQFHQNKVEKMDSDEGGKSVVLNKRGPVGFNTFLEKDLFVGSYRLEAGLDILEMKSADRGATLLLKKQKKF